MDKLKLFFYAILAILNVISLYTLLQVAFQVKTPCWIAAKTASPATYKMR